VHRRCAQIESVSADLSSGETRLLPAENECPECDRLVEEIAGFHQSMRLGTRQDMDDIVAAVAKIYENRSKLAARM